MMVAGSEDAIFMVESEAKELSEDQMLGAILFAQAEMQPSLRANRRISFASFNFSD